MKAKDLMKALEQINPEADVVINVKQCNKRYGFQLPIEYGTDKAEEPNKSGYSWYLNNWVNMSYGGSITVHLPSGAYVAGLPKDMKLKY